MANSSTADRPVTGDASFQVQAAALDTHAATLDQIADEVSQGRSAAASIAIGRDAYGILCQLIPTLLEPIQEATITALQEATDSLQRSADDLRATASDYNGSDRRTADDFNGRSP
jgi:uncharacterized protein YukE